MQNITTASEKGCALYHEIWQLVDQTFFDRSRMQEWSSFEHRFDSLIVDDESALRFADEMLASLKDTYTERMIAKPAPELESPTKSASSSAEKPSVVSALRPDGIGYLFIPSFDSKDIFDLVAAAVKKIADCKGVVLDLRNNSGGRMHEAIAICGFFLTSGVIATIQFRHENGGVNSRQYCLVEDQFFARITEPDGSTVVELFDRVAPVLAGKPLVILMNKRSASASEVVIAALVQNGIEGQVLIVGNGATPGKGIGQAEYEVQNSEVKIRVTRTHWLTPGGEWLGDCGQTKKDGIEPHVVVDAAVGTEGVKEAIHELCKILAEQPSILV